MVRLVKIIFVKAMVATLCLLGVSGAQANKQDEAKKHYKTALELFQAEEFESALPHFKKAYEVSKKRPVTILGLAQCERALKMYPEAIKHFEEYLASNPPEDKAEVVRSTLSLTHKLWDTQKEKAATDPLPKVPEAPPPPPIQAPGTPSKADSSVFAQPWFWIVTGVVAVGGGVAAAFALSGGSTDADSGTTGVLIRP